MVAPDMTDAQCPQHDRAGPPFSCAPSPKNNAQHTCSCLRAASKLPWHALLGNKQLLHNRRRQQRPRPPLPLAVSAPSAGWLADDVAGSSRSSRGRCSPCPVREPTGNMMKCCLVNESRTLSIFVGFITGEHGTRQQEKVTSA